MPHTYPHGYKLIKPFKQVTSLNHLLRESRVVLWLFVALPFALICYLKSRVGVKGLSGRPKLSPLLARIDLCARVCACGKVAAAHQLRTVILTMNKHERVH